MTTMARAKQKNAAAISNFGAPPSVAVTAVIPVAAGAMNGRLVPGICAIRPFGWKDRLV